MNLSNLQRIGIDAGGTLIKIAYEGESGLAFRKFPSERIHEAAAWVAETFPHASVCATGGKAEWLQSLLESEQSLKVRLMVEFDATCAGAQFLMQQQGVTRKSFVLTNVGTGTSIHLIDQDSHKRVGGTGVGGGTLMGLSYLFAETRDYEEIVRQAEQGVRRHVDLTVFDIYEGSIPPIPGDLTASNFGSVHRHPDRQTADILAAVTGLVGETVTTVSVHAAAEHGVATIVYVGSTFAGNALLQQIVASYTKLRGAEAVVLENGDYCGAIGAFLSII